MRDLATVIDTFDGHWESTPERKARVLAHFAPQVRAHVAANFRSAHARLRAGE